MTSTLKVQKYRLNEVIMNHVGGGNYHSRQILFLVWTNLIKPKTFPDVNFRVTVNVTDNINIVTACNYCH